MSSYDQYCTCDLACQKNRIKQKKCVEINFEGGPNKSRGFEIFSKIDKTNYALKSTFLCSQSQGA